MAKATANKAKRVRIINAQMRPLSFPSWNLICANGHMHYALEPMTWIGYECGTRYYDETGKRRTCKKKQMLLEDYKPERTPKPVKKRKPKPKKRRRIVPRY